MLFYKLDYTVEKTLNLKPELEQKFLLDFTGKNFPAREAEKIWLKVIDHKWYISERLGRDVGLRVAAIDYITNFYEPSVQRDKNSLIVTAKQFFRTMFDSLTLASYFKRI